MKPLNARFWVFINGGHVKLTLKPGQILSWGKSWRHEEGWSSEAESWEHAGDEVRNAASSDGCDCDGRLSRSWEGSCKLERLREYELIIPTNRIDWTPKDINLANFLGHQALLPDRLQTRIALPDWHEEGSMQRDYTAEAKGY